MALGGVQRQGEAGGVQQGVVGAAGKLSGSCTSGGAQRGGFRPGREVSCAGERVVHEVFPGADLPISVSAGAVQDGGIRGAAAPLLDLWKQGSGREAKGDAAP